MMHQTNAEIAAADFERDGDFEFARKPKRTRTEGQENVPQRTKSKSSSRSQQEQAGPSRSSSNRRSKRHSGEENVDDDDNSRAGRFIKTWEPSPTPKRGTMSSTVALPTSDTPVINRNKEMRKGKSKRRSSHGSRGRRASSLIENGQTATPHGDVDPGQFYKHIASEGLPEPRRMKQLLMWCGERALPAKPPLGTATGSAMQSAREIQDLILKDFASRSDISDWFSRDDQVPKPPPTRLRPNPRNAEMDEKLAALEKRIQRLQDEKKSWESIQQSSKDTAPLYSEADDDKITLPDMDRLEPEERKTRTYLAQEMAPFATVQAKTEERLRRIQASLESEVDQLADHVHKLEQRVLTASREADTVLRLSATRLKAREQRDKTNAGTRDLPLKEVLRGLSGILPGGDG